MKIIRNDVRNVSLSFFSSFYQKWPYLYDERDKNHYKLLAYLSMLYNNEIFIDAGTRQGHSCMALAQNPTNKVITYDINNTFEDPGYSNVEFKLLDINQETDQNLNLAKIIMLDIDPHQGTHETIFFNKLKNIGYCGILICDDIHLNSGMNDFWNHIDIEKIDLTDIAHWSGTGLVNFSKEIIEVI
jgi:hypothetical protein